MRKAKGKEKLVAFESTKGPQKILIMDGKSINPTKRTTKKTEKVDTLHHKVFLATDILDVAFRKIITPRGKTFEITLSDGTQVALNADSKFTFQLISQANRSVLYNWREKLSLKWLKMPNIHLSWLPLQ